MLRHEAEQYRVANVGLHFIQRQPTTSQRNMSAELCGKSDEEITMPSKFVGVVAGITNGFMRTGKKEFEDGGSLK